MLAVNKTRVSHSLSKHNTCKWNPTCTAWPQSYSGALYPEPRLQCCANWIIRCFPTLPPPAARAPWGLAGHFRIPTGWQGSPPSPQDTRAAQELLPMASSLGTALGWPWAPAPNLQDRGCSQGLAQAWQQWEGCSERVKSCKKTWYKPLRAHTAWGFNLKPIFNRKLKAGMRDITICSCQSALLVFSTE